MSQPPSLAPSGLPEATADDKMMGLIAHLSIFIIPVLGPLVLYLVKKDSPFVQYHAIQALLFQLIIWFGSGMLITILTVVTLGFCGWIGCVGYLGILVAIPYAIKANNGEWEGYPLISNIGKPA
jgi:uncharacterized membrane protein